MIKIFKFSDAGVKFKLAFDWEKAYFIVELICTRLFDLNLK